MGTHNPQTSRFFLMTIDPVHIGTGGTRLGRVDLSIVREPGTRLPKIPGTSFSGAIRSYAAYRYGKRRCAGQGQPGSEKAGHCGRPTCPICYTFGAITGERSYSGVVSIGDARILLFPVYSMVGPMWVSTVNNLKAAGINVVQNNQPVQGDGPFATFSRNQPLNLGWLMIETPAEVSLEGIPQHWQNESWWQTLEKRIVLVSDKLFSQIVNSNLEVRTSVSINPETGAAEEGALFTYEAIPRATVLWMDVVVDDYRGEFPNKNKLEEWSSILSQDNTEKQKELLKRWRLWKEKDAQNAFGEARMRANMWLGEEKVDENGNKKWRWERQEMKGVEQTVKGIVTSGLEWCEHLGIGGMGTRGFGRVCMVDHQEVPYDKTHA